MTYETPRPTYTKWFWKDLLAKTQDMTASQFGAYVRLLGYAVTCSDDFCSLPNDDNVLCRVSGLGLKAWRRDAPAVVSRFELTDAGRLRCGRLSSDASEWAKHCQEQRRRRTGCPPAVDRGSTGTRPEQDHTRAREMPDAREEIETENLHTRPPAVTVGSGELPLNGHRPSPKAEWLQAFDEDFYPDYPRKVKPDDARKAWLQMKPWTQDNCDAIFAGLAQWVEHWNNTETPKDKISYPATFLRSGQWKQAPE